MNYLSSKIPVNINLSCLNSLSFPISHLISQGQLVLSSRQFLSPNSADNDYGCDSITPAKKRGVSGYPWVLLIRRGSCDFVDKVGKPLFYVLLPFCLFLNKCFLIESFQYPKSTISHISYFSGHILAYDLVFGTLDPVKNL